MKTLKFGVNAVVSGQKSSVVNAEPQLLANSTNGKFTITAPVSKALSIAAGENVMFLNNIAGVEEAIQNKVADLVDWANENGVDLDTAEGQATALAEFTQWYIAKGELLYDQKGNPKMSSIRYTEEEKKELIAKNAEAIVEANRDALLARLGVEDATFEELVAAIEVDDVETPKFHSMSGSKTSTTSAATGVGLQLGFTDTSIWNSLKADLDADSRSKFNRVYSVNLTDAEKVPYNNGYETVEITAYPITFVEDKTPMVRGKKD